MGNGPQRLLDKVVKDPSFNTLLSRSPELDRQMARCRRACAIRSRGCGHGGGRSKRVRGTLITAWLDVKHAEGGHSGRYMKSGTPLARSVGYLGGLICT